MAIFKKRMSEGGGEVAIQRSSELPTKEHHSDIHDPILTAIRDAQPFEEQNNHQRTVSTVSPESRFRDMFGNVITNPDHSNPTRQRNERPLDTIRAFEYACTGDERIREEMETPRLGWSIRNNPVPAFTSNPYAANNDNVISFGNSSGDADNQGYTRPMAPPKPEKKKRGLFGRKKK
ncbi:hypothetical protein TRICI_004329 [Trichomonascus ciferrii]|uniref:Uncharacterized protein n=1 Tax=Trichomonascus ciferrii TaxID=44093 RepID=A0A642V166_9ASCO|nr:hypothetical protein TRICI_004329 [Trichomonascus ciferrii]